MERRLYFIAGDLLACGFVGALAATAASLLVGSGWNMLLAMLVGMAVGMALALPGALLFMPFFGAMEVMVPAMLSGMLAGMAIGMAEAMISLTLASAAWYGAQIGFGTLVVTSLLNGWLRSQGGARGSFDES
jgi:hypothetical protein